MHLAARDIDRMHLSEWVAAVAAHNRGDEGDEGVLPPTPEEHDALLLKHG